MRLYLASALLAGSAFVSTAAPAQVALDGRVDKLEREMKAVQRKVFPGGNGAYLEPQITAPTSSAVPGTPATSPVADLAARVSTLESQIATMTGNIEQAQYKLRTIDDAFNAYKRSTDARLQALEGSVSSTDTGSVGDTAPPPRSGGIGPRPPVVTPTRPAPAAATPASATPAKPDPVRAGTVERPSTGDAAEDGYTYGYRLWQAKLYPEAEAALKDVVAKYPQHRRASFSQNLLGRAYLDEGRPSLASMAFYDNYKKMPDGERAPDSLFYLAQALVKLNKPADACKVYVELTDSYGAKISDAMKGDIARGRTAAKCK